MTVDFGSIDSRKTVTFVAGDKLGLESNELVVLRIEVRSDLRIRVQRQTRNEDRSKLAEKNWIDIFSPAYSPRSEFWLWGGDREVAFLVYNPTKYPLTVSKAAFLGWSATVSAIDCEEGSKVTVIEQGWPETLQAY